MKTPRRRATFAVAKQCGWHIWSNLYEDFAIDAKVNVVSAVEKEVFIHTLCISGLGLDELTAITALLKAKSTNTEPSAIVSGAPFT